MALTTDEVRVDSYKNKAGTREYGRCTAWVNFDGTGTVAIRDALNVSSITDTGVGAYTVNFGQSMANVNYSVSLSSRRATTWADGGDQSLNYTAPGVQIQHVEAGSFTDSYVINVQIFGGDI